MEISEVRIFLKEAKDKKLKAYAAVTFDNAFVVHNIKIIEGSKGLFVAMPSRKLKEVCLGCGSTNSVNSKFCNECGKAQSGARISAPRPFQDGDNRQSDHRDIAHPINSEFRDVLQRKILAAYETEKTKGPASAYAMK